MIWSSIHTCCFEQFDHAVIMNFYFWLYALFFCTLCDHLPLESEHFICSVRHNLNVASFDVRYCAEEPNNETDPSSNRVQLNRAAVQPWVHFGRIALSCFALPYSPLLCCNPLHSHVLLEYNVPFQMSSEFPEKVCCPKQPSSTSFPTWYPWVALLQCFVVLSGWKITFVWYFFF